MYSRTEELQASLQLDLYEAGWENSEEYPGISLRQIIMNSLSKSLLKKFHEDETDAVRDEKALALFKECNERCRSFDGVHPRTLKEELIINEMKSIIYDFFNPHFVDDSDDPEDKGKLYYRQPLLLNLTAISSNFSLGSGSNIGASSTDLYTKLANSRMSHTDPVLPILYRQAISGNKLWSDVEAFRTANFETEIVAGSRLSFAPKSREISRTICTEPVLNMLFQKGIGDTIRDRLLEFFGISLTNPSPQPDKNAELARIGSESGRFGTIDLSSASDTISLRLVKELLPTEAFNWLIRCRSPVTILPDGSEVELHMISSMGNGYTFPLQTMIFSCLVAAVYRVLSIKLERPLRQTLGNFAVFGDDIIVDSRAYNTVVDCLELLGFRVNREKSFNEGLFRESCGRDYSSGYNVRGVYLKRLNVAGDFYSAINRLNRWSTRNGILLCRTVSLLRNGCRFSGVPYDEADDAGIKVPLSLLRSPRRNRNGAVYYRALVNVPRRVDLSSLEPNDEYSGGELDLGRIRIALPDFIPDPSALLLIFLAGQIRNSRLGLRSLKPKAVLRTRVCPGWDERLFALGESREYAERWKMFSIANLVS